MAALDKSSMTFHFCIYDDDLNGDIMVEIMILQTQCALVFPLTRDTMHGPERGFQMRAPRVEKPKNAGGKQCLTATPRLPALPVQVWRGGQLPRRPPGIALDLTVVEPHKSQKCLAWSQIAP